MKQKTFNSTWTKESEETDVLDEDITTNQLVVFNDDYNSFEKMIFTLMRICGHTPEQAEQCTWIIHHKGKCSVKEGSLEELTPMKFAINDEGINAEVC